MRVGVNWIIHSPEGVWLDRRKSSLLSPLLSGGLKTSPLVGLEQATFVFTVFSNHNYLLGVSTILSIIMMSYGEGI